MISIIRERFPLSLKEREEMERLKGIQEVVDNNKQFSRGQMILIKLDDAEWLIQQVEKLKAENLSLQEKLIRNSGRFSL